jgi:hypothetical protein
MASEEEKPIKFANWRSSIKPVRATKAARDLIIRVQSIPAPSVGRRRRRMQLQQKAGKIDVIIRGAPGKHAFGPVVKAISIGRQVKRLDEGVLLKPHRPEHLSLSPLPARLPREYLRPYFIPTYKRRPRGAWGQPTTVFTPDTRYTFSDTSYPWSSCGRVDTAAGWGSGVMVGPRHLLTASHVVNWGSGNSAGWLKFTPLFFDGSAPFGVAWATLIYWWNRANPADGINAVECAFDFVVCILDTPIGNLTGWMGSRGYSTSWNSGSYWGHVGYPGDMAGGQRPAFHGPGVMDSTFTQTLGGRDSFGIRHRNDVWPGQSGGPFFGWWQGEVGPHVVSSQSAQNWGGPTGPNTCGGGDPLPVLVRWGLDHNP